MFTRRGFLLTSSGALSALALAGSASAASSDSFVVIASPARATGPLSEDQHFTKITLSGDRLRDLSTLEDILRAGHAPRIRFVLDAADEVMLDLAQSRTASAYHITPLSAGMSEFRLNAVTAGV
ncbi:hypothetical protein [Paracoccus cavernae]|uniref:hypothetical protein n=1 Tax=Paracoccus cavernae TaxID=1571207 RepID=UPI0035F2AA66